MSKRYVVYQGYAEQWRWREIDENNNMVMSSELFPTAEEAADDCYDHDPDGDLVEIQKPADFSEGQPIPEATE